MSKAVRFYVEGFILKIFNSAYLVEVRQPGAWHLQAISINGAQYPRISGNGLKEPDEYGGFNSAVDVM
jgi:hypothetical protein